MTEIEVLGHGKNTPEQDAYITTMFEVFRIYGMTADIKKKAIFLRKTYNLKLADSIIGATAWYLNLPLISADQVFQKVDEINFVSFQV